MKRLWNRGRYDRSHIRLQGIVGATVTARMAGIQILREQKSASVANYNELMFSVRIDT